MERSRETGKIPRSLTLPAQALMTLMALAMLQSCYKAKPASGTLDISKVPENVAILLPIPSDEIDYGAKPVGSSTDFSLTLGNAGPYPATELQEDPELAALSAPFSFKDGAFPGTGGTCTATLESQETCTVILTYSPMSVDAQTGTLNLNYVNGVIRFPLTITLKGTTTATLAISGDPTVDFGISTVATPVDQTLTLTNTGAVPATALQPSITDPLTAPYSFKGGTYPGAGGDCGASLGAGDSCQVVVTFNPDAPGQFDETLSLAYGDGNFTTQTATRDLTGTGLAP